jgi:hypothetical protein
MADDSDCKPSVRSLYAWETEEARRVFGSGLRYDAVRIHECTTWTNSIDRVGRRLKGLKPLKHGHNALTLGNHCYFPIRLPENFLPAGHPEHYKLGWLIHELTHVWQYQHMGWNYLIKAVGAQMREKAKAYDFGQEEGLKSRKRDGWTLRKFNLEQQGDIARTYYERICRGEDVTHWQDFIDDLKRA